MTPALLLTLVAACPTKTSTTWTDEVRASVLGAAGYAALVEERVDVALDCLRDARKLDGASPIYARDHAAAALERGRPDEALEAIESALANGDVDPDAQLLRATILAALGKEGDAVDASRAAGTWEADLLGAALSDRGAVHRAIPLVEERTRRGAIASLVLASHEASQGSLRGASRLASIAQERAAAAGAPWLVTVSRDLYNSIEDNSGPSFDLRLRSTFDHTTNPAYAGRGSEPRRAGLRLGLGVQGGVALPIGALSTAFSASVRQDVFITERDVLSRFDITSITLTAAAQYPLSEHPSLAVLGVSARFVDVFGDLLGTHFATAFEGGPDLTLELAAGVKLRLGLYGVAADVIDTSPPDLVVSSLNRDYVGQRATVTLYGEVNRIAGVVSVAFLHDDALGDAFDALGGAASGQLIAYPTKGVELFTKVGATVREFGPVGDRAIIGPAATRTELRLVAQIGARVALGGGTHLLLMDTWIDNRARRGHDYAQNVLSVGVEADW